MSIDLGSPALDVLIGLSFIFFVFSLLVTALSEFVAAIWRQRAKTLAKGVRRMMGDATLSGEVLSHPLMQSDVTTPVDKRMPSYVAPRDFALATIDVLGRRANACAERSVEEEKSPGPHRRADRVRRGIETVYPAGPLGEQLRALWDDAELSLQHGTPTLAAFRASLERWFEDAMDRVSGWYKRWSQLVTFVIALALAVGLNVDAIRITERLANDPAVRAAVVSQAETAAEKGGSGGADGASGLNGGSAAPLEAAGKDAEEAIHGVSELELPILWGEANDSVGLSTVAGWLATAIAISLGAPFWFDALGKLAHLKASGKKPEGAG